MTPWRRFYDFCNRNWWQIHMVMIMAILALLILTMIGCGHSNPRPPVPPAPVTQPTTSSGISALEQQLATAKAHVRDIETNLQEARQQAVAVTLYWFIGIMAVLAAGAVAMAIFVPAVASWALRAAVAAAALASLAGFAVWLLPWLVWIGGALAAAGILAVVAYWRLDAKSRDQVVRAVEAAKTQLPGYKGHFREFVDEDADTHLDAVRVRLGLKKP